MGVIIHASMYIMIIGNGVKINPANNNLMTVLSMCVKSAIPPQTPPIMLLFCRYNLFIILYNVAKDWRDIILRSALPFIAAVDYHQFDQF